MNRQCLFRYSLSEQLFKSDIVTYFKLEQYRENRFLTTINVVYNRGDVAKERYIVKREDVKKVFTSTYSKSTNELNDIRVKNSIIEKDIIFKW